MIELLDTRKVSVTRMDVHTSDRDRKSFRMSDKIKLHATTYLLYRIVVTTYSYMVSITGNLR